MGGLVVIAGSLAQKPRQGGHTWQFLNYLLGFRKLGWDVLFLDRIEPEMCFGERGDATSFADSVNLRYFREVMDRFGLEGRYSLIHDRGREHAGLSRKKVLELTRAATLLINVMGFLDDEEILGCARRRVFLDTDPGFGQMWQALGLATLFRGHDDYVTIAENIGRPDCTIPDCGLKWTTWRQPIVLDEWMPAEGPATKFTSIGSWRGPYAPVEYQGVTYGLRAHQFRKFAALPGASGGQFEVALDIHTTETRDIELLRGHGWSLADPALVAADPWVYRDYIRSSLGEFMATKGMYVQTRSGWFSERSICYLASGRPVLAQDTGIAELYPVGEGLLTFNTLDEAVAAVHEIRGNYAKHCRAARALAEAAFDSDKVLAHLLSTLAIS